MSARIVRRQCVTAGDISGSIHPLLKRIYLGRGVTGAEDLDLGLDRLIPLRALGQIEAAVQLLIRHFHAGGRITVIGDFDADGATSTALMVRQLRSLGFADVDFLVPNRFDYGYGLTPEIVALAAVSRPALIITVDNGISSHAGVEAALAEGIETLITDHHLPASTLPAAAVIVNPNSPGETFPSKSLAGVGVAFYVMALLTRSMQQQGLVKDPRPVSELLDLVALGTVADLVALDHNNRILVHQGLRRIRAGRCTAGVRALLEMAGKRPEKVVASDLGFQVGPRLNAAGRLDDMSIGIQCLLTDDSASARLLAGRLAQLNQDRKELELRMQQDALGTLVDMRADDDSLPLGLCLFADDWHQGVVGLVASRVKERTHRPVIAFARADGTMLKGSARSVAGVHIRDVLDAVAKRHPELIHRFGGHAMAAGLSLPHDSLEAFRLAFDTEVRRWMTADDAHGVIQSDGVLGLEDCTLETARIVREAGPWGQSFPEPTFDGRFSVVEARILSDRHLKLKLRYSSDAGPTGPVCEAIAFRYFDHVEATDVVPGQQVEIAFRMDINEYGGKERLQLLVEHLEVVGT